MNMILGLVNLCDAYCAAARLSRSRLSTIIFNDGKALDRVAGGGDLNTRSYEKAIAWLSENWPEDAVWPDGVERPSGEDLVVQADAKGAAA